MTEKRPSEVLGSLPRTRPQRRSTKRPVREESGLAPAAQPDSEASGTSGPVRAAKRTAVRSAKPTAVRSAKPAAVRSGTKPRPIRSAAKATPAQSAAKPRPARAKRGAQPLRQPPQPRGIPSQPRAPVPPQRPEILGTAVQAATELAEIGLALSARALRRAASRIPRP